MWRARSPRMPCADIGLFQTTYREIEGSSGATLSRDPTFICGACGGELVEATGEVIPAGKSLIIMRGQIHAVERVLTTCSGVMRILQPRG